MKERKISEANFSDTGYSYTLSLIAGKYKPIVLYCLMEYEPVRFNEMRRYLGSAAGKTRSQTLKELERENLMLLVRSNDAMLSQRRISKLFSIREDRVKIIPARYEADYAEGFT